MVTLYLTAVIRTIKQFFTPPILKAFWKSVLATIGLAVLVSFFLHFTIKAIIVLTTNVSWLSYLTILGDIGAVALSIFAFPAVLIAVSSLFLEDVITAVEQRYYPSIVPVKVKFRDEIWLAIKFFFVVLGVNLLALPFYLIPALNVITFIIVNTFLIMREYYELIAIRHIPKSKIKSFKDANYMPLFWASLPLCGLLMIPILNLFLPIIATLFMAHILYPLLLKK